MQNQPLTIGQGYGGDLPRAGEGQEYALTTLAQCAMIVCAMERVNVQFDEETFERIRLVAFRFRKSIAEIIRRCVQSSLEQVERDLTSEKKRRG